MLFLFQAWFRFIFMARMSPHWFVKQLFNCFIHYLLEFSYEFQSVSSLTGFQWVFLIVQLFWITFMILRWLFCHLSLLYFPSTLTWLSCHFMLDIDHRWISDKSITLHCPPLHLPSQSPFLFPLHLWHPSIHPCPPCLTLRPYVPCFTEICFHVTMILSSLAYSFLTPFLSFLVSH